MNRLFTVARTSYHNIFGDSYPIEQMQDDLENYRPLELVHKEHSFRYRIWRLAEANERGQCCADAVESLFEDLEATGEVRIELWRRWKLWKKCA